MSVLISGKFEGTSWKFSHDPDELASTFHSHSNTFIKFIHENYLNTLGFNMDGATLAIDSISLGDVMNTEWRVSVCIQVKKIFNLYNKI